MGEVLWFCTKYFYILPAFLERFEEIPPFIEKSGEAGCRDDSCVSWLRSGNIQ